MTPKEYRAVGEDRLESALSKFEEAADFLDRGLYEGAADLWRLLAELRQHAARLADNGA